MGEAIAARHLEDSGYEIIAANYYSRYGEIDLIAGKDGLVCFVEVKLRKNSAFSSAAAQVGYHKRDRLRKTALMWLAESKLDCRCRFDVIEVYAPKNGALSINHIEAAFE